MTATALETRLAARYTDVEITKGMTVEVYKGRKVPKGTEGVVFWLGAGNYGYRVGLKDDAGETHWTALDNCRAVCTDKDSDESWVEYDERKTAEAAAAEAKRAALPARFDIVVVLDEPEFVGKVFWMSADGARCGIAREGARRVRVDGKLRNKDEDTRWVDTDAVVKRCDWTPELAVVAEPEVAEAAADDLDDDDMGCF